MPGLIPAPQYCLIQRCPTHSPHVTNNSSNLESGHFLKPDRFMTVFGHKQMTFFRFDYHLIALTTPILSVKLAQKVIRQKDIQTHVLMRRTEKYCSNLFVSLPNKKQNIKKVHLKKILMFFRTTMTKRLWLWPKRDTRWYSPITIRFISTADSRITLVLETTGARHTKVNNIFSDDFLNFLPFDAYLHFFANLVNFAREM